MDPTVAVQVTLDWPDAVNCCVAPSVTLAVAGVTVIGGEVVLTKVTVAVAVWLVELVAVMVTVLEVGMVAGAVKRPVALMLPADADQVALEVAVNCWVAPKATLAVAGETLNAVPPELPTGIVNMFEKSEPGFFTLTGVVVTAPS
jgi:hypothetical protein